MPCGILISTLDPAMLRPDFPAMPGTVFLMNISGSGLQRNWPRRAKDGRISGH